MQARRDDITDIRQQMFDRFMEHDPSVTSEDFDTPFGYVYLVRSPHGFKIGRTSHPDSRFALFRTASPYRIELLAVIYASHVRALERALHRRFADKKIRGEWYALTDTDAAFISGLTSEQIEELSEPFVKK